MSSLAVCQRYLILFPTIRYLDIFLTFSSKCLLRLSTVTGRFPCKYLLGYSCFQSHCKSLLYCDVYKKTPQYFESWCGHRQLWYRPILCLCFFAFSVCAYTSVVSYLKCVRHTVCILTRECKVLGISFVLSVSTACRTTSSFLRTVSYSLH